MKFLLMGFQWHFFSSSSLLVRSACSLSTVSCLSLEERRSSFACPSSLKLLCCWALKTVCFHQHMFGIFLCCCLSLFDALNFILNGLSFLLSCCTLPALSLFIQMPIISSPCSSSRHQEWLVDLHFQKSSNRMDVITVLLAFKVSWLRWFAVTSLL